MSVRSRIVAWMLIPALSALGACSPSATKGLTLRTPAPSAPPTQNSAMASPSTSSSPTATASPTTTAPSTPASPSASPSPPPGTGKRIEISLSRQQLTAWSGDTVVMQFLVSTGRPGYRTPAGRFRVLSKSRMGWSRSWGVYMPWMMQFKGNYTIHQLPNYPGGGPIGASELGRPASHGCVRVGVGNAERLWRWTPAGTPVWIH